MANTKKSLILDKSHAVFNRGYDIIGSTAIVKFDRSVKQIEKKKFAVSLLQKYKSIKTVLEKTGKFSGRLRIQRTKYLAGEKTKEALHKEAGCEFRLNVEKCYFSPRLSNERLEIANSVGRSERVLVLFGGVAPFAILIAKIAKPERAVSVELGRECNKYAADNIKRNKVNVSLIQGDVRRVLPKMKKEKFDRIVMARPNLKDSFLDVAFPRIKTGGIIHYYGFYAEKDISQMKDLIEKEAKRARKKIKILRVKKAGDIGVRKFRYRADIKILD